MSNVVDFFKRRRVERAVVVTEVVDLTSDDEAPVETPLATPSEPSHTSIPCPICNNDIALLQLEARESHVELCLLHPQTSSYIHIPSPKKPAPEPPKPKQKRPKRPLPDFKILTLEAHTVIVDGFCYAEGPTEKYFLTHFHSDHYGGLTRSWSQGTIYCSKITADLTMNAYGLRDRIVVLEMDTRTEVEPGLFVTLYDANHCPGAAVFLFETEGKKVLHTGDFRVSKQLLDRFHGVFLDEIYLDTTYLNPMYSFYDQRVVIDVTVQFIKSIIEEKTRKKNRGILDFMSGDTGGFVVLVGSYSIGKEKIYLEIARALGTKIFVTERRYKMLELSGMDMSLFEKKCEDECMLHVVNFDKLSDKLWLQKFNRRNVIKVRPTGWSFSRLKRVRKDEKKPEGYSDTIKRCLEKNMTRQDFEEQLKVQWEKTDTLNVPYSEHSSFKELTMFGSHLQWGKMIPTVNVDNQEFDQWFQAWKDTDLDYTVIERHYS